MKSFQPHKSKTLNNDVTRGNIVVTRGNIDVTRGNIDVTRGNNIDV
jgi:hypothetical protein